MDVVCKITPPAPAAAQVLRSPRFGPELSCCLQDGPQRNPQAKPLRRNALSPELRCCLQDSKAAACGHAVSAPGDCARQPRGGSRGIASNSQDCERAIFVDCRGIPLGTRDRRRSSLCGNRCGAFAGTRLHCRLPGEAGTSMAGKPADNNGSAVHPYGRCRISRSQI